MSIDLWFLWFEWYARAACRMPHHASTQISLNHWPSDSHWSLEDLHRLEAVTDRGETPLARAAARGHGAVVSGWMWEQLRGWGWIEG